MGMTPRIGLLAQRNRDAALYGLFLLGCTLAECSRRYAITQQSARDSVYRQYRRECCQLRELTGAWPPDPTHKGIDALRARARILRKAIAQKSTLGADGATTPRAQAIPCQRPQRVTSARSAESAGSVSARVGTVL